MFEREVPAAILGAFAGALWDVSSGVDGFNTLVLMILCAVSSLLISHLMQNNLITALVIGAGSIAAYEILYIVIRFWGAGSPVRQIFTFYLPSLIITGVFIPICYFLVKFI
jgi:rod shape-determining protein MreD